MEKPGSSYTLHIVVAGNVGLILRWPCFVRFQIAVVWHRVAIPSIGFRGNCGICPTMLPTCDEIDGGILHFSMKIALQLHL